MRNRALEAASTPRLLNQSTTLAAGRYLLDPGRSTVRVRVRHLFGLGTVSADVALQTGQLTIEGTMNSSSVQVVLDTASFRSGNTRRDRDVMSAKYLDVAAFPSITFESNGLSQGDDGWVVTGVVTAHGVSAPVDLALDELHEGGREVSIRAHAVIDRYAHGVTAGKGMAGRWLTVDVTAIACREVVS